MADQPAFTQADVDSLAGKLTQFKQTLTEGEVAAMAAVFQSGIPQAEDVEGYSQRQGGEYAIGVDPPLAPLGPIFSLPLEGPREGHPRS
jgi:hypothetical protein